MRFAAALLGLAPQLATVQGQVAHQASTTPAQAQRRFAKSYGGDWTVWNGASGVAYRVFGPGADVLPEGVRDADAAQRAAALLVRDHGALLGVTAGDVTTESVTDAGNVLHVRMQQSHRGVPVHGARIEFVFHKRDGRLVLLGSEAVPGLTCDVEPRLRTEDARRIARAEVVTVRRLGPAEAAELAVVAQPRLEIFGRSQPHRLAWRVSLRLVGRPIADTCWVDAKTGRVLHRRDDVYRCRAVVAAGRRRRGDLTGTVRVRVSTPPRGIVPNNPPRPQPISGALVHVAGVGSTFTNVRGEFRLAYSGTKPVDATISLVSGRWWDPLVDQSRIAVVSLRASLDPQRPAHLVLDPKPSEATTAQANAAHYVARTHDYVKGIVPSMTAIDRSIGIQVNGSFFCNAFFDGKAIYLQQSDENCFNSATPSIVAHEYGHFVDAKHGGIGDGLNWTPAEGIADLHAVLQFEDPFPSRDLDRKSRGRSAINPWRHPVTDPELTRHLFGQPFMGLGWDWLQLARERHGRDPGKAIVERAFFRSVALDARDMLDAVLKLYIADDDDSRLDNGTPHIASLARVVAKRGFVRDVFRAIEIAHDPLGDTTSASRRVVSARVRSKVGRVARVELWFDDGRGEFVQMPMRATSTGVWQAATGAVERGRVARYYLVAHNDRGNTHRLPPQEGDAFCYAIGRRNIVLSDDFEQASGKFRASNGNRLKGWIRAAPFGRNFDPPAAASGRICWGTHRSLRDERYPGADGTDLLDSVAIDTRAYRGLRLRFRRWLTVDGGATARVRINGAIVQAATSTTDRSWRYFDLDVSRFADARERVVICFELAHMNPVGLGGMTIDDVELYALEGQPGWSVFGAGCRGGGLAPRIEALDPPRIGRRFESRIRGCGTSSLVVLLTGRSCRRWGTLDLPLSLAPFGAPGCTLFVPPDELEVGVASATGEARIGLDIPRSRALAYTEFLQQPFVLGRHANALGAVFGNALRARISD